ncbi:MAG: hypothetical protein EBW52_12295, partial [Betaproteobacteria bacterium]|nr:hypothetical protein [Betaproteobacteria bacterium]
MPHFRFGKRGRPDFKTSHNRHTLMLKSMANPRLPPPDETFDHARLSRNPGREPRLSLREATQQAIASRAGNPARTVQQRAEAASAAAGGRRSGGA